MTEQSGIPMSAAAVEAMVMADYTGDLADYPPGTFVPSDFEKAKRALQAAYPHIAEQVREELENERHEVMKPARPKESNR